ncbi:Armadillo repeat-containing protein 8 [Thoreauomyces humboldtii]|nr:Armadillo repeat-containing protein 8 [Thoreauomyces humboldtii]
MAITKHEAAVSALQAHDPEERTRAVRFIKNSVIGNRTKKEMYLGMGVAARLVEFLRDPTCDVDLRVQVAVVLGSFAYGNDRNISVLVDAGAITPLLGTLSAVDMKLVEAGARALKAIFQSAEAPHEDVFQARYIDDLIRLLTPTIEVVGSPCSSKRQVPVRVSEVAAGILAKVAVTHDGQMQIVQSGAIPLLTAMFEPRWNPYPKMQEAALDALANLCRDNPAIAVKVAASPSPSNFLTIPIIIKLVRDRRPVMRLLAATCVTNIYRTGSLPSQHQPDMVLTLLPTLIKLFNETAPISTLYGSGWATVQEKAPKVFADLVESNEELQKAALEADAITKLAAVIIGGADNPDVPPPPPAPVTPAETKAKPTRGGRRKLAKVRGSDASVPPRVSTCGHAERVTEGFLRAVAAMCSLREECRKQVIDAKLLPHIVTAMSHPNRRIRSAACECTRSLSRSVKNLRTSLVDAGVGIPLFRLLSDESEEVQLTASATLCNIVLDFSPMKRTVLENGGVERLVDLAKSMDDRLRLNAVWALKNLLFQADSDTKARVMTELRWDGLLSLIDDSEIGIQEQALNLLRNLACGKEEDVEQAFLGLGESRVLDILESKLKTTATGEQQHDDVVLQALYVIVNVATGNERHKAALLQRKGILESVWGFMKHTKSAIRVATVWCLINLTWTDDPGSSQRVARLRELDFHTRLQSMTEDFNMDVKDRVKTALANFGLSVPSARVTPQQPPAAAGATNASASASAMEVDPGTDSHASTTTGTRPPTVTAVPRIISRRGGATERERERERERRADLSGPAGTLLASAAAASAAAAAAAASAASGSVQGSGVVFGDLMMLDPDGGNGGGGGVGNDADVGAMEEMDYVPARPPPPAN